MKDNTTGCSVKNWTLLTNDKPSYVTNNDYGRYFMYNHYYGVKSF